MICATDGELPPEPAAEEPVAEPEALAAADVSDWAAEVAAWVVDSAVVVDDEHAPSSSAATAPTVTAAARPGRRIFKVIPNSLPV